MDILLENYILTDEQILVFDNFLNLISKCESFE
jgi:hypothetical protein